MSALQLRAHNVTRQAERIYSVTAALSSVFHHSPSCVHAVGFHIMWQVKVLPLFASHKLRRQVLPLEVRVWFPQLERWRGSWQPNCGRDWSRLWRRHMSKDSLGLPAKLAWDAGGEEQLDWSSRRKVSLTRNNSFLSWVLLVLSVLNGVELAASFSFAPSHI